jgi:hypothetical protein
MGRERSAPRVGGTKNSITEEKQSVAGGALAAPAAPALPTRGVLSARAPNVGPAPS